MFESVAGVQRRSPMSFPWIHFQICLRNLRYVPTHSIEFSVRQCFLPSGCNLCRVILPLSILLASTRPSETLGKGGSCVLCLHTADEEAKAQKREGS